MGKSIELNFPTDSLKTIFNTRSIKKNNNFDIILYGILIFGILILLSFMFYLKP